MHAPREIEFDLGAGMGTAGRALQLGGEQGTGARRRRPAVVVHAHHPQRIEGEPGALEHAEHLDRRLAACFRLEHALAAELGEAAHRLAGRQRAEQRIEPAEAVDDFAEGAARLELVARQRAVAGPAGGLQRPPEDGRPFAGAARPAAGGEDVDQGGEPRDGLRAERRLALAEALGQPHQRRRGGEVGQVAAQRGIEAGAAVGLGARRGPAAGEQQFRQACLLDLLPAAAQRQQVEGDAHQRLFRQRTAEREVEAARQFGGIRADHRRLQRVVEQAFQAVADRGEVGCDDAEAAIRPGVEPCLRP